MWDTPFEISRGFNSRRLHRLGRARPYVVWLPAAMARSTEPDMRSGRPTRPGADALPGSEGIPAHAERLLAGPRGRGALALTFSESTASAAEVLVEGDSFYPRMLDDIASAS